MNLTQQRKIEKIMQKRIQRFRQDLLETTMGEILARAPARDGITEREYESYLKDVASYSRATERLAKKVKALGNGQNHRYYTPDKAQIIEKHEFDKAISYDAEKRWANERHGNYNWVNKESERIDHARQLIGQGLARDEKQSKALYPTLLAWYAKDTAIRDFADEGLVIDIYIAEGDGDELLEALTNKLSSLV